MWRGAEMSENERILQVKSKLEVLGREPKTWPQSAGNVQLSKNV